jgi:hypothetical protein
MVDEPKTPIPPHSSEMMREIAEIMRRFPRPPLIDSSKFSKADRDRANQIWQILIMLNVFIEAVSNDLSLDTYANNNPTIQMQWAPIASRDAATNIWSCKCCLDLLNIVYGKCKSAHTTERKRAIEEALSVFTTFFPEATDIRDVIAHAVHKMVGSGQSQNSLNNVKIYNSRFGGKITNMYDGRELSFELNERTVSILQAIRDIVFEGFRS